MAERSQGRGRRRSRAERPGAGSVDSSPAADEEETDALAPEPELAEEEMDTLSDWNVPSWNELIASLYRPDR
jgi:hypothetical protein